MLSKGRRGFGHTDAFQRGGGGLYTFQRGGGVWAY